jgi:signal transduction histidine kinase
MRRANYLMIDTTEQSQFLVTLPPSRGQIRWAICVGLALLAAFFITVPFTKVQLARVDAFIPSVESSILISDLITAVLLAAQFAILRHWAFLELAGGYFFTALIVIPHALTFPGLIAPTGFLGAGPQSTAWLYIFWHLGLPLTVLIYALRKDADSEKSILEGSPLVALAWGAAVVLILVCGFTWIATAQEMHLPRILDDGGHLTAFAMLANWCLILLGGVALLAVFVRRRSVLDLWLMVVILAYLIEVVLSAQLAGTRFSLGYYAGRFYSLITAVIVLLVLLSETTTLHARLASSIMRQRRDHQARQIAMEAMAASIAHEVNQPLSAIATNGQAALLYLRRTPPNNHEALAALDAVVADSVRGAGMIAGVRAMFQKGAHGMVRCDVDALVREVVDMLDVDLRTGRVSVSIESHDELPELLLNRGQLQQVFLNVIMNAIEAMRPVTDRARQLKIRSETIQGSQGVLVTVADSGPGMDRKDRDRIFEPFFTTKSSGMGIGLTICRSIIEAHGGTLSASVNKPYGTIFRVALPSNSG